MRKKRSKPEIFYYNLKRKSNGHSFYSILSNFLHVKKVLSLTPS